MRSSPRKFTEARLFCTLRDWFRLLGFQVYSEVPSGISGPIDLVAVQNSNIVVVELKMALTQKVLHQASLLKELTSSVYCGIGTKPQQRSIVKCTRIGVGIISIQEDTNTVLEPKPECGPGISESRREVFLRHLEDHPEGGLGGLPMLEGSGPAQKVRKRVVAYKETHPGITWDELYDNVKSHYTSSKSMCSAMSNLKKRSKRR